MKKNRQAREEGMALIIATVFVSVALIALAALSVRMVNQDQNVDNYIAYENCIYGINSALEQSIPRIEAGGVGNVGISRIGDTTVSTDGTVSTVDFSRHLAYLKDNDLITVGTDTGQLKEDSLAPFSVPNMPGVEYLAIDVDWGSGSDGLDNDGDLKIDEPDEQFQHTIYALAGNSTKLGVVRMVEVVVAGYDVNVWNNAVFAGGGGVGASINGNVSVHGSVHVLGDGVLEGGTSVEMSGTAFVHNYYSEGVLDSLHPEFQGMAPPIQTADMGSETGQRTLNAEFRCKQGLVSMDGDSQIGHEDKTKTGNGVKDNMDGVYINDGWTGNKESTNVFSDNGVNTKYDLGNRVPMPYLDDAYQWPRPMNCTDLDTTYTVEIGDKEVAPLGTPAEYTIPTPDPDAGKYTHEGFYSTVLSDGDPCDINNPDFALDNPNYFPSPKNPLFVNTAGVPTITLNTTKVSVYKKEILVTPSKKVYINLTRPADKNPANRVKDGWDADGCGKGDDYLYYDPDTKVMEINGQVEIDGNLILTGDTIYYNGRGSLLVRGNVTLNTNLYTCNKDEFGVPDITNTALSFPENNCLGLMVKGKGKDSDSTAGNITISTSQRHLMGAFYAEGTITSSFQSIVMGTFVSTQFNIGSQVPEIWQVPTLAQFLPIGMIGACPIMNLSTVSWREIIVANPAG